MQQIQQIMEEMEGNQEIQGRERGRERRCLSREGIEEYKYNLISQSYSPLDVAFNYHPVYAFTLYKSIHCTDTIDSMGSVDSMHRVPIPVPVPTPVSMGGVDGGNVNTHRVASYSPLKGVYGLASSIYRNTTPLTYQALAHSMDTRSTSTSVLELTPSSTDANTPPCIEDITPEMLPHELRQNLKGLATEVAGMVLDELGMYCTVLFI